ncbi:MAG: AzlC family ABC transporter permease [Canibacter sp.]
MSNTSAAASRSSRNTDIIAGLKDSLSVGLGVFPLGIALGMLVMQAELPWWLAPALSIGVYAGSVELLLVSLIASVTPLITIAVTVFAVNFRHVFYSFSFPLHRVKPGLPKVYSVYSMTDEAFATYAGRLSANITSARIVTMQFAAQSYWVLGSLVGILISGALPAAIEGFEFALCALFTVMTLDAFRSRRQVPSLLLAVLSVSVAMLVVPQATMLAALLLFVTLLTLRFFIIGDHDSEPVETVTGPISLTDASRDDDGEVKS